jgi:hypothetical protein
MPTLVRQRRWNRTSQRVEKYFSGVRDKPLNRYPVFQKLGNYCSRLEKTHFTCYIIVPALFCAALCVLLL